MGVLCVVYIPYSESIREYYTGHTRDLQNRHQEHNSGETPSLRNGIPWTVVWMSEPMPRSEAMKLEAKIKSRGAARFLQETSKPG